MPVEMDEVVVIAALGEGAHELVEGGRPEQVYLQRAADRERLQHGPGRPYNSPRHSGHGAGP